MVKLTDNEWAILEVLWADGPCELGDLVSALAPTHPWRRNTVHTYLTRMESKGLVAIDRTPLHGGHRPGAVCPPSPESALG